MTTNVGLVLCLTLLAFGAAGAVGSAISAFAFRLLGSGLRRLPPAPRARAYLTLRLGPAALALMFTGVLFLPAFLIFEPRDTGETVGPALLLLAAAAALPLARSLRDGWRSWRATREVVRRWLEDAEPLRLSGSLPCRAFAVDARFPVVAVVGVRSPLVVVSRSVLDACSAEELSAIVAHEAAHIEGRDNLVRLLIRTAPDILSWTGLAPTFEREWEQAAEEAADEGAGRGRALDLASALLKVARLAESGPPLRPALATLCQGGSIARRIRLLVVDPPPEDRSADGRWRPRAGLSILTAFLALAAFPGVLRQIHSVIEILVGALQ